MKVEWTKPELKMLDVSQTFSPPNGTPPGRDKCTGFENSSGQGQQKWCS